MPKQKSPEGSLTRLRNAIDTLVANIRFAGAEEPVDTIAITSSVPNEGKSTVATNLAQALAENGDSVLLVECDVHRRTLATLLGVRARTGLYSVLLGRVSLADAVVVTHTPNMTFLDCEPGVPNPSNVFASAQFRALVRQMRSSYDYVVFDTPPLSAYVDGAVVGSVADATLLVVRWNYVKRDDVRASMEQLEKADVNVIGTVLNCCEDDRDAYYYGGYKKPRSSVDNAPQIVDASTRPSAALSLHAAPLSQGLSGDSVARPRPFADSTAQFVISANGSSSAPAASPKTTGQVADVTGRHGARSHP